MSVATAKLIAKLTLDVASIVDEVDRLDCAVWLEEYALALPASVGSTASNVQSYSISGRTVSYRSLNELNNRVSQLRQLINGALYGRNGVIDNRLGLESFGRIY